MYSLTILHRFPKQTSLLFAMGVKPRRVAHSIFTTLVHTKHTLQ
jgi:hypothetical protein